MKSVYEVIRDLRVERRYTVLFLSKSLKMSKKEYRSLEAGEIVPILNTTLVLISKIYGCPVELLLDFDGVEDNKTPYGPKPEYYIQHGCAGYSALWWMKDGVGYTTEIDLAGRFSKSEAKKIIERHSDSAWLCHHIDTNPDAVKFIVDVRYLNSKYHFSESLFLE